MKRYAVKIGEIHLVSNEPITEEARKKAVREVGDNMGLVYTEDGLTVEYSLTVNRH